MSIKKLSNIPLKDLRKFLKSQGLNKVKTTKGRGGHEKWTSKKLDRPIVFQSHIDPVPEFIVRQILRHLNMDRKEFSKAFEKM